MNNFLAFQLQFKCQLKSQTSSLLSDLTLCQPIAVSCGDLIILPPWQSTRTKKLKFRQQTFFTYLHNQLKGIFVDPDWRLKLLYHFAAFLCVFVFFDVKTFMFAVAFKLKVFLLWTWIFFNFFYLCKSPLCILLLSSWLLA